MKYLILSTCLLFLSCGNKLFIARENVKLINQNENFILGTNELNVVIEKVSLNPKNNVFTVHGYTDFLMAPDKNYSKYPKIKISKIHDGDTTYLTQTKKWGKFKIKMQNIDTALFNYDQWKILTID